jgi:glycogen(starch) synthase
MRVLMFGWEFPPHISGGLGTACFGITQGLSKLGMEIVFVLPRQKGNIHKSHVRLISANGVPLHDKSETDTFHRAVRFRHVESDLIPYAEKGRAGAFITGKIGVVGESSHGTWDLSDDYGPDMFAEADLYGRKAGVLAKEEDFDVIHCHDWMTVHAGIEARRSSGRPFIYHVHSLEFDRSGEDINRRVYDIEHKGLGSADHIISVSHYTKKMIVERYGIKPEKVTVVHNAVSQKDGRERNHDRKMTDHKIVLFLGRITFQKGPDTFIEAAARVLEKIPSAVFVMAGSGDMMPRMVERVARLRMGRHFHFTGFIRGEEVERIFAISDIYVMPSVSEPFGISPLEAVLFDVPVIISKQSGVSEILNHALKVDFWDVNELSNKIIAVLTYPALVKEMTDRAREEIAMIRWNAVAEKIVSVYRGVCD